MKPPYPGPKLTRAWFLARWRSLVWLADTSPKLAFQSVYAARAQLALAYWRRAKARGE